MERRIVIEAALRDLIAHGYKLRRLRNLRGKHIARIIRHWKLQGLKSSTLSTYVSHLRTLCRWLEKPQLVELIERIVMEDPTITHRRTVTDHDRSLEGAGLTFEQVFSRALELNPRFAAQLALSAAFGLRALESWLFRPHLAESHGVIRVQWGTKGGRPRVLPLAITKEQAAVLSWAKTFAQTPAESMIPRGVSVQRWRWRYYALARRLGLTRKALGVTAHSLRHEALLKIYEILTGEPAAVRGGTLYRTDPKADLAARSLVAETAGHSRTAIAGAYLGGVRGSHYGPRSIGNLPDATVGDKADSTVADSTVADSPLTFKSTAAS